MENERRYTKKNAPRVLKMVRLLPEVDEAVFTLAASKGLSMNAMINLVLKEALIPDKPLTSPGR